ncbi:molybdopterin-dependent oxidoreductase [Sphingobium sp. BYY-5]|uniref:molybdopterin oxidoreductase family protein n=1 Tax=Sphingobium sp. BYY-5 TaxID=2926400 RepID=UPI001FA6AFB4|nr:molybdopterin-dependent oxidoreductase [Sphingobium sp. BYY-5]MCI4588535.1 molybdopterin-dependent oxidoreductase [Sphingobium sp. BYY-5]
MAIVRSQCGQCAVGCGIRVLTGEDRQLRIEGDATHPANGGLLCARARVLEDSVDLDGRLLDPLVHGRRQSWDRVIAQLARRLSAILARHGPGSIALHVGGGLLTEDYYVANKLMKGFFGSAHIHAPWRGGLAELQRAAYGEDVMPAACEDIGRAGVILLLGATISRDYPVLIDRVQAARADGARLIHVAPAGEGDALEADLHLPVAQDSIARLIGGLLLHCYDTGLVDPDWLTHGVAVPPGYWDALRRGHDIWSVARGCGLPPASIRAFYELWAADGRALTLSSAADDGASSAILNLHLATGRIGRPGAAPFLIGGGANGMGAREVGCKADSLAAHMGFDADALARTARFWGARNMVQETGGLEGEALLEAMRDGRVKALWSIGADAGAAPWLTEARALVPLSIRATDRAEPDATGWTFQLPSAAWIEKDGTLTGMDRLISRQRRLLDLPGAARPDWWMLTKVAQAMGWNDAFHYEWAADIYREHVRLTAYQNDGMRLLNLKRHAPISNPAYEELTPWRWGELPFDEGCFPTPDGRARLLPVGDQPDAAMS